MTLNLNNLRTFYNALVQKFKSYRGNWEQNDTTADDYIKNRPFYEETKVINEPLNIIWDGNTEGLLCVANCMYKISDLILTDEQIKSIRFTDTTGASDLIGNSWDDMNAQGFISENSVNFYYYIVFVRNYGLDVGGAIFPEPGIYVYGEGTNYYISSLISTEPIEKVETTIHKLDKKFIDMPKIIGSSGTGENSEIFNSDENSAEGIYSHAEGQYTVASGSYSHAEGYMTNAEGYASHTEGNETTASGSNSHAEGKYTTASSSHSHAEGFQTVTNGDSSHAEGFRTQANGRYSHAEGSDTTAESWYSHAEGYHTIATGKHSHVQGRYNIADEEEKYAHIVGNGNIDIGERSNAHTLDWEGNAWYSGTVEGTAMIISSPNGTRYKITVSDDGALSATAIT